MRLATREAGHRHERKDGRTAKAFPKKNVGKRERKRHPMKRRSRTFATRKGSHRPQRVRTKGEKSGPGMDGSRGGRAIRRERRSAERPSECTSVACRSEHSAPNSRVRRTKTGDRCTAERHPAKLRQVEWQYFYSLPQEKEGIGPGEPGQKEGEREKRPHGTAALECERGRPNGFGHPRSSK